MIGRRPRAEYLAKCEVRSLNGLKFDISKNGRTAHLLISSSNSSRRPEVLSSMNALPLNVGETNRTPHLVISAPNSSRLPGELDIMIMYSLKVGKSSHA